LDNWMIIVIVGWVLNYGVIGIGASRSAEGYMGMGLFLIIGLIPYSMPVLGIICYIRHLFSLIKNKLGGS